MSALALCINDIKETVIGSDNNKFYFTEERLKEKNIEILTFNKNNISRYKDHIFIIGHSYNETNNEEVKEIFDNNYEYYYYSDFINHYFKNIKIGISGTHGKTTTTTLTKTLFDFNQVSYIIGDGNGKGKKNSKYLIFEACEYYQHFLNYDYEYLIINNIDYDHPDYYNNIDEVITAFKNVSKKAKKIIINNDDENCEKIEHKQKYTFGIKNKSYVNGEIIEENKKGYIILVKVENNEYIFSLPFHGKHMIYNFLAAFTVYYLCNNIDKSNIENDIKSKIRKYKSPRRRKEEIILENDNIIIDDYAHHPKEIEMIYEAVRQKYNNYNITIVFQPHTYSRTIYLNKEFKDVLKDKEVYIMKTFISREEYDLLKESVVKEIFINHKEYDVNAIKEILNKENQIILCLGAGDIHNEIKKWHNKCKL